MHLRKAILDDALMVLEWRNDEITRKNSFNHEIIDTKSHINWFKKKLNDNSCFMFILEDENEPVGNIRVDLKKNVGEISYMIDPKMRGRGYGTIIIGLVEGEIIKLGIRTLVAFVRVENSASARCFDKNGYIKLNAGDIDCYIKDI